MVSCERHNPYSSNITLSANPYEGIPLNLVINIIVFTLLTALFLVLRKVAWNYGNIGWMNKPIDITEVVPREASQCHSSDEYYEKEDDVVMSENKFWLKIPLFIRMSDLAIEKLRGSDAVIYFKFQRSLIFITFVMMVSCMTIILPLNWHGGFLSNESSKFPTLTIANIPNDSNVLWVHMSIALALMLLVFYISCRFLNYVDVNMKEEVTSTLMISNVPVDKCDAILIEQYIEETYPSVKIVKVQKTFEVEKLFYIYTEKNIAEEALQFCYDKLEKHNERIVLVDKFCGRLCILSTCCKGEKFKQVDGIEYYSNQVQKLTESFLEEKKLALSSKRLPVYFVTLETLEQALQIRKEYIYQNYCCIKQKSIEISSLSETLHPDKWSVTLSALPTDIIWQNLNKKGWRKWMAIILTNTLLWFIVIIASTPAMVLQFWDEYKSKSQLTKNPWISQFSPSLLMVLISSVIQLLVFWSVDVYGLWTKTKQHIAVMDKLFTILVITILILPSLGIASIQEVINQIFNSTNGHKITFKWECIFMGDGGAIYCNYLISAAFIGVGFQMLRIGELITYAYKLLSSRSRAENNAIAKSLVWNFPFGMNYAYTLSFFAIIAAYSVIVPLVTPFGLFYLIMKHFIDRYNMIHVNSKTHVHNSVHVNAIKLMQVCLTFTQGTVFFYVIIKQQYVSLSICCCTAFVLGNVLSFGRALTRAFTNMAWIKYNDFSKFTDLSHFLQPRTTAVSSHEVVDLTTIDLKDSVFVPPQMVVSQNSVLLERIRKESSITSANDDIICLPNRTLNYGTIPQNIVIVP